MPTEFGMSALYNLRHSRLKAYVIGCRAAGRTPEVPQNVADSCKPTMPLLKWQKQAWQASPKPSQGKLSTRLGVCRIHVTISAAVCHRGWIIFGFYLFCFVTKDHLTPSCQDIRSILEFLPGCAWRALRALRYSSTSLSGRRLTLSR